MEPRVSDTSCYTRKAQPLISQMPFLLLDILIWMICQYMLRTCIQAAQLNPPKDLQGFQGLPVDTQLVFSCDLPQAGLADH
jgi:hypothetical protein